MPWYFPQLGSPVVPFYPFFGEGSPTEKRVPLLLTSLLDLAKVLLVSLRFLQGICTGVRIRRRKPSRRLARGEWPFQGENTP